VRGLKFYMSLAGAAVLIVAATLAARAAVSHSAGSARHGGGTAGSHSDGTKSGGSGSGPAGHGSSGAPPAGVASAAVGLRPGAVSPNAAGIPAAVALAPRLSALQLAGQRIIYSYTGLNPPASLLWLIAHGEAAGVIFFSDNVGTGDHLLTVARRLNRAAASRTNPVHLPLLLMTDQEGGAVRRLPGAPVLSAKQVGEAPHPWRAATAAGAGAGANLRGHGLNVNLAPVLDVFRQPGNFIDEFGRSFSSNPVRVAKLGALYAGAEQRRGVAATVKHFPGLGAAARSQNTDERPVTLRLRLSAIRNTDEVPYRTAVAVHVKLVMVSWAVYPALDRRFPAGLSRTIIGGELRNRLGFAGVTITDALSAGALRAFGTTASRATRAARAGMDLLLCASERVAEGSTAMRALSSAYRHGTASYRRAFRAAAERVMALRKTLP
jgi:beta-N-acetylhexosaminidase